MMRKGLIIGMVAVLLWSASLAWAGPQGELPQGEGHDLVQETCTACHTQAIILQNRMTREAWDHTITWMQEKQGLWELKPEERSRILDYLAKHMGPQSGGGASSEGPARHKMYQYDYKPNPL